MPISCVDIYNDTLKKPMSNLNVITKKVEKKGWKMDAAWAA